jgi:CHAT domain-containing protein/tetratricopeptide (TPR) repeat protein
MIGKRWAALCVGMIMALSGSVLARNMLTVPDDFPTIQAAVDAADPGDTVFVRAGRYTENVVVSKPIRLQGEERTRTIITAGDPSAVTLMLAVDKGETTVEQLLVSGGAAGIGFLGEGTAVIQDCIIAENEDGIWVGGTRLTVTGCYLWGNKAAGVFAGSSSGALTLTGCEIVTSEIGIMLYSGGSVELRDCLIGLVSFGVESYDVACGWEGEPGEGTRRAGLLRAMGTGNRIHGSSEATCPDQVAPLWPKDFVREGWAALMDELAKEHAEGTQLLEADRYAEAAELYGPMMLRPELATFPVLQAECLQNGGVAYRSLGKYEDALAAYKKAGSIYADRGMYLRLAGLHLNVGAAYGASGQLQEALAALEAARALYLTYGTAVDVANVDRNLANVHNDLGRYEEALAALERARAAYAESHHETEVADADFTIANTYAHLGQYREALDRYLRARTAFEGSGREYDVANTDYNISIMYRELGDSAQALAWLERARAAYMSHGLDLDRAYVERGLAALYLNLDRPDEALAAAEAAHSVFWSLGAALEVAAVDLTVGIAYSMLGRPRDALAAYERILLVLDEASPPTGSAFSHPDLRWRTLFNRAVAYESLSKWEDAVAACRQAIEVIESVRKGLRTEELKSDWQELVRGVYEHLIDLLSRMGQGTSALPYAERCRARTLLDLLAAGPVGTLENVRGMELKTGVVDPQTIEADLQGEIASLPADTATLEYFVTESAVLVWVVTREGVQEPTRVEIRRGDLANDVIGFRQALEAGPSLGNTADEALLAQSRDLYALLVQPIEDKLAGMTHVVIIPSGPLHYLPFAALLRSPGTEGHVLWSAQFAPGAYFGDQYALSYAPSLVALKYAQEAAGEVSTERSFLALADPDSGDPALTRLPEARVEAEAVAALFSTHEVYVDRDATEAVVQSQSSTASQLLLSTHGLFNAVNPMYSYLVLAPTEGSDGRLHTYEVFGLDLHADLVVLSACETLLPHLEDMEAQARAVRGSGEEDVELSPELMEELTSGDEIVGLTRAFLYAGTPSVLASLWSVYSEATKDLMVAFYGYLNQGMDKAEALRQAQRDVRRLYPHPAFWAAFNLVGDWR